MFLKINNHHLISQPFKLASADDGDPKTFQPEILLLETMKGDENPFYSFVMGFGDRFVAYIVARLAVSYFLKKTASPGVEKRAAAR